MTQKFFYATTTEIHDDGWGLANTAEDDGDLFELKPGFSPPVNLVPASLHSPWNSLGGITVPSDTVMITCWIETTKGVIDLYGDMSFFVGDLQTGILPWGGRSGNYIVLVDGRALQVLPDDIEFVKTISPKEVGLKSFVGQPNFCQRVYKFN